MDTDWQHVAQTAPKTAPKTKHDTLITLDVPLRSYYCFPSGYFLILLPFFFGIRFLCDFEPIDFEHSDLWVVR